MKEYFEVNEAILIFAFRHVLGKPLRQAELVGDPIRYYWKDLSDTFKDQVRREIKVFIERDEVGGMNEIAYWDRISQLP